MKKTAIALTILALAGLVSVASANNVPQTLPFTQNWSTTTLIAVSDDWSGVPGIVGYRGDDATAGSAVDPQTVTADYSAVVDVNANNTNPNTFATGGVTEFDTLTDPVVALQGSGTGDFPNLVFFITTAGKQTINVRLNLRDVDGSADNAIQPVAIQYRVGNAGAYTNLPTAFTADASTGPSLAVAVTPINVTLPAACDNQLEVDIRVITSNAVGNDEWIGVDDINITGVEIPVPTARTSWSAIKAGK